ncbi:hypothetical protein EJ357_24085 [Streptomyces cyaneochromogenes]|uniref:Lipoprotein n=1 Tax=Streptomyces cyaneochromogenes TaxID=2496836 RepID=A0A3Q9EPG1_9ACTN|nr:hypothetical protein [Streptomyces cyaneochromogenes]AZQ36178.1 hypothetical protein EJ357_24085 [Streptomyces cyaneochromogenes]
MRRRLFAAAAALLLVSGVAGSAAASASANAGATASANPAVASVQVPAGVTAGVAVFDRQTGTFTEQLNASARFRSASVVKLLLALDFLWNRGPDYSVPAADRARLEPMLRSSNDQAANHYWSTLGGSAVINRMVGRLGLQDTAPPPAGYEGYWGYTSLSARDTVTIYRYLLDSAPGPVRDFVMGNLRQSTRCASDRFDQHFGIAGAFEKPWAVKQGWAGSSYPEGTCGTATALRTAESGTGTESAPAPAAAADVDLTRPALHSTGTVGAGDRNIVAVYTLHPVGTSYGKAYTDIGRLTRSLNVPGAARPAGWWYGTWSDHVNVRPDPSTGKSAITQLPAGAEVLIGCQARGEEVRVPPYTNDWWAYLPQYGGWISNIYVSSPDNKIPDVKEC